MAWRASISASAGGNIMLRRWQPGGNEASKAGGSGGWRHQRRGYQNGWWRRLAGIIIWPSANVSVSIKQRRKKMALAAKCQRNLWRRRQ
jgi:hypothetical protein